MKRSALFILNVITILSFTSPQIVLGESRGQAAFTRVKLSEVKHWAYNIQQVDTMQQRNELVGTHFDLYVLEPVVTEKGQGGFNIAGLIKDIKDYNKVNYGKEPIVLAYVDIGQAEDWRWYWQDGWGIGNPDWIVTTDPDDWEGNYPVAYWHPQWQNIVIYGHWGKSHVQAILESGFDGIYMDWVEAFSDDDVRVKAREDGVNPAHAMLNFIARIRTFAQTGSPDANPEFLIVAQNASDLHRTNPVRYEKLVDAIALEAVWYNGDRGFDNWADPRGYNVLTNDLYPGWTEEVLSHLRALKGKMPIFIAEYAQNLQGNRFASRIYNTLAPQHGFIPLCTRRSLARLPKTPYPKNYTPIDY